MQGRKLNQQKSDQRKTNRREIISRRLKPENSVSICREKSPNSADMKLDDVSNTSRMFEGKWALFNPAVTFPKRAQFVPDTAPLL